MRLLLDAHALLWFYLGASQLSPTARTAIMDPGNAKLVSPASYWELAIKMSIGKLVLNESYDDFIQHAIFDNGFGVLDILPQHTSALIGLAHHHRDPFDRLLVAQSLVERIPIVSSDVILDSYGVQRLW